jgi:hypothetical protein
LILASPDPAPAGAALGAPLPRRGAPLDRLARSEPAFLLGVALFACGSLAGLFLWSGSLYQDSLSHYSFFYDNLDSLNRFGRPAWWSPQVHHGTPGYFVGLLQTPNLGKPAFVALGALAWGLGRLGVGLPFVTPIYVLYFTVLVPCLFLLGVWLVARRTLRSPNARRYVLVVAAFSPGVLLNLSDPGVLENTAYTLYVVAAYLSFLGRPDPRSFAILCLASLGVAVAVSHSVLVTAFPLLPLLLLATACTSRATRAALRRVRAWQWAGAALLAAAVASPSAIAYLQQRGRLGHFYASELEYAYGRLKGGNPLEFLLASVPSLSFDWDRYLQGESGPPSEYRAEALRPGRHGGYAYLGLLAVPLAGLGLLYGRRPLRLPLFVLLAASACVFLLSAYSPLFSLLLVLPTPLRSFNHYGDLLYRGSGFLLLLFAAGLGLEAAERHAGAARRLPLLFLGSSALGLGVFAAFQRPRQDALGLAAMLVGLLSIALVWAARGSRRRRARGLAGAVLALTLVDVSTVAFWHVRLLMLGPGEDYDAGLGRTVGIRHPRSLMTARQYRTRELRALEEAGVSAAAIPGPAAFCRAHTHGETPGAADLARAGEVAPPERSLALPEESREDPRLRAFFAAGPGPCSARLASERDYNEIRLEVTAAQPALVLLRDGWSPYWKATVEGRPTPVYRALGAFKAVPVPAGSSEVVLDFEPPLVGAALLLAYAILAAVGVSVLAWPAAARSRRRPPRDAPLRDAG